MPCLFTQVYLKKGLSHHFEWEMEMVFSNPFLNIKNATMQNSSIW